MNAKNDHEAVVKLLIDAKAEFRKKQPETVKALLKAGADVHAKNIAGQTALDRAQSDEIRALLREAAEKGEKK